MDKSNTHVLRDKTFSRTQFYTIIWVMSGVALAFCIARIAFAWRLYSRLRTDDILVILAMTCLLISDILNTYMAPKMFMVQAVQAERMKPPAGYKDTADTFARYQWAVAYLFFTSIWAVKGSFLAFYDGLTNRLTLYRRAWWATIVLTILTYIGSLFAYAFLDGTHFSKSLRNQAIKYQFSADITTDALITLLPLSIAFKSQIPLPKKLALSGVFSLSLVVTIISMVRFIVNQPGHGIVGPSWLQVWSCIEQSVSVIMACVASLRTLVINKSRASEKSPVTPSSKTPSSSSGQRFKNMVDKVAGPSLRSHEKDSVGRLQSSDSMDIELLEPSHAATRET